VSVRNLFVFSFAIFSLVPSITSAQTEARITVVQPGVNSLTGDLGYLVGLSPTPQLRKRITPINSLIADFSTGLQVNQPMRVDFVFGKEISHELHVPVAVLEGNKGFLKNLSDIGDYFSKEISPGLYSLSQGKKSSRKEVGFLRMANNYASIATSQAAIPANSPHPISERLRTYLQAGNDVTAELKCDPADSKGLEARRANFKEFRKQLEAGIKFKRDEDKNAFELRKLSVIQNLDEAERFLVETESLVVKWITDVEGKKGHGELALSAIPETSLHGSAKLMGAKPSYFVNVTQPANSSIKIRFNLAIDSLRASHLKELYKTIRPTLASKIDKSDRLKTPEQKSAAKKGIELLIDMLNAGIDIGAADGFMDLVTEGKNHSLLCGIRTADGKMADEILKLLPQIRSDFQFNPGTEEVSGVKFHTLVLSGEKLTKFQKVFPTETTIVVGTSKDTVWLAAGTNSREGLKTAIEAVGRPAPETLDPVFAIFDADVSKIIELWDTLRPEKADSKGPKSPAQKEREKIRGLADQAFEGSLPRVVSELKRNGDSIEGRLDADEAMLRFIGTLIADFAKQFE